MPVNRWNQTIDLKDTFHNDDLSIPAKGKIVADRIRVSGWLEDTAYPDTLRDFLAALEQSETAREFDNVWSDIYDVADEDRVWIETR